MKKMKKSFLFPLIGIIAVITIVGVGFAAWAIFTPASGSVGGNITAETLTDRTFTLTGTTNDAIHFGYKKTEPAATLPKDQWFTKDEDTDESKLTANVTITLTPQDQENFSSDIKTYLPENRTIVVSLKLNDASKYASFAAITDAGTTQGKRYLATPVLSSGDNSSTLTGDWSDANLVKLTLDYQDFKKGDGNYFTATVTITFAWGDVTDAKDPFEYFNQLGENGMAMHGYTDENKALATKVCAAASALNAAPTVEDGQSTYTVMFETSTKAA